MLVQTKGAYFDFFLDAVSVFIGCPIRRLFRGRAIAEKPLMKRRKYPANPKNFLTSLTFFGAGQSSTTLVFSLSALMTSF
ncbi:hypothetical protein DPMN_032652 [Dreissena polymorpha]|uniref:Uncharacterized protein n=1 Tax=Dreissena polymorpha TaxID=45954 RepID=A0A9D4M3B4_DREPO|nr:hypothetical protein DPMN_032652 [Dreissena polymorpha]